MNLTLLHPPPPAFLTFVYSPYRHGVVVPLPARPGSGRHDPVSVIESRKKKSTGIDPHPHPRRALYTSHTMDAASASDLTCGGICPILRCNALQVRCTYSPS